MGDGRKGGMEVERGMDGGIERDGWR